MLASAASLFIGFTLLRSAVAGFVLYYIACCVAIPLFDLVAARGVPARKIPAVLGFGKARGADVALGVISGLVMVAVMIAALALLKDSVFGSDAIVSTLRTWGLRREYLVLVCALLMAFNGAIEEFFWRGYLHERLASLPNRFLAIGLTSAFFGAQHLFVVSSIVRDPAIVALFLTGILGAGAVWGVMRERTKSLVPSVISHMAVTAGYLGVFLYYSLSA